jgi:hypothetical protein
MKFSKLMKERIRRTSVLFKELGYELVDSEVMEDTYTAGFEGDDGFQGGVFIDRDSKFLELAFTFTFSPAFVEFVREKLEEMLQICYEYGCYVSVETTEDDIALSVFSKIYYAGLNYFSLKETLKDFREAVSTLEELFDIERELDKGSLHGDS